jgi:hypothetical protein
MIGIDHVKPAAAANQVHGTIGTAPPVIGVDGVIAAARGDGVIPRTTEEIAIPIATRKRVVARAAIQIAKQRSAIQQVVSAFTIDAKILGEITKNCVVSVARIGGFVVDRTPRPQVDIVVATMAIDGIVIGARIDCVVAVIADDVVVTRTAVDPVRGTV